MSLWCVVVTYNRPKEAEVCVDALLSQTLPPDRVLIVENSERAEMAGGYAAEPLVEVIRPAGGNIGASGCFALGVTVAFERGASAVVLAADDFTADPTMLEELLKALRTESQPAVFVAVTYQPDDRVMAPPLYADGTSGVLGHTRCRAPEHWDAPLRRRHSRIMQTVEELRAFALHRHVRLVEVPVASFHGMLISRQVYERVGGPRGDFVIYGDDNEFCLRAHHHKFPILVVAEAGGRHSLGWWDTYYRFGPFSFLIPRGLRQQFAYYATRNYLWVSRLYDTGLSRPVNIARVLSRALRIVVFGSGPAPARMRSQMRGIIDGLFRDPGQKVREV